MTDNALPSDIAGIVTAEEIAAGLEVARAMIRNGVPVFAASPCPADCPGHTDREGNHVAHNGGPGQYHLPFQWDKTVPSEVWLDPTQPKGFRPGYALAAIGGRTVDFLDVDPRNEGDLSLRELHAAEQMPMTFGRQSTPSGGEHYVIAATGERKSTGFMPGLDLQAGDVHGQGRGFVWIAPTVRPSKDPSRLGELVAYRWIERPDFETLDEFAPSARDSAQGIIDRIAERRAAPRPRESAPAADAHALADPFLDASLPGGSFGGDRSFTLAEAQDFVRPVLIDLQQAKIGTIEETANIAAATLSHFVPAFWSADEAMALLEAALSHTAYDPNGPSNWTAEKFRPVLDGRRPPLDAWRALRRAEPPAAPAAVVEAESSEEEALSTLERLRRKLVSAKELSQRPAPEPLVQGLLNCNSEAWMIGAPGSLKSFIALDIAAHVGAGIPWQGRRTKQRDVLYIAAEGESGMVLRTRAYIAIRGDMPGVTVLPYPVQVKSNDGQWEALTVIAREMQPGLIVIDTQHRVSAGLEENSATDIGILLAAVTRLRRVTGACILVIHHTGRNGKDARGSSAIDGAQDTELKIIRAEPRSSLCCTVVQDKQKDMAEGPAGGIPLELKVIDLGTDDQTGEPLSSLVVKTVTEAIEDPYLDAQGVQVVDVEPWRGKAPEPWTGVIVPGQAWVKRRILQVLADHAGMTGLTEATARKVVGDRWEEPSPTGWSDAWQSVKDLDPYVVNGATRDRWTMDQVELKRLRGE